MNIIWHIYIYSRQSWVKAMAITDLEPFRPHIDRFDLTEEQIKNLTDERV